MGLVSGAARVAPTATELPDLQLLLEDLLAIVSVLEHGVAMQRCLLSATKSTT